MSSINVEPSTLNFDDGYIMGKRLGAKLEGGCETLEKLETPQVTPPPPPSLKLGMLEGTIAPPLRLTIIVGSLNKPNYGF